MKTYQTLSLIGCLLGMLMTAGLIFLTVFAANLAFNPTRATQESAPMLAGFGLGFIIYIVLTVVTFTTTDKRYLKALGIAFLIVGFIAVLVTIGWGIIPYALLIPAGVLAIKEDGAIKKRGVNEVEN